MIIQTSHEKVINKPIRTLYIRCENPDDWGPVLDRFNKLMEGLDANKFHPVIIIPYMSSKTVMSEQGPQQQLLAVKLDIVPTDMNDAVYEHTIKDIIWTLVGDIDKDSVTITEVITSSEVNCRKYLNDHSENTDGGAENESDK